MPLAQAEKQPLTTDRLREQLGRLGGTPFKLGELKNCLAGEVMLPVSELNRLRREAVQELETQRAQPKRWTPRVRSADCGVRNSRQRGGAQYAALRTPHSALDRPGAQPRATRSRAEVRRGDASIASSRIRRSIARRLRLVRRRQSATPARRSEIFVAPPRIFKLGEEWTLKQVRSCDADGYLVRNYDHLSFFANDRRIGDYSLNIANRLAADYFKNKFGLERVTASYDLNFAQLEALLHAAPPEWFEITIHQHMPMFHMEHCVFCAFLSTGTDYTQLRPPVRRARREAARPRRRGASGQGRRRLPQHGVQRAGPDRRGVCVAHAGAGRAPFPHRVPERNARPGGADDCEISPVARGEITGAQLWRELKLLNQLGVTRGQKKA